MDKQRKKTLKIFFGILLGLTLLVAVAFLIPGIASAFNLSLLPIQPTPYSQVGFITVPGNATPTPTPYQPLNPTPTFIPTSIVGREPIETPSPPGNGGTDNDSSEPQPRPIGLSGDYANILLLGSDQRPYDWGFRTDTIVLAHLNFDSQTVSLISFPRDLYVNIPGYGEERINTAMARGGFPLMQQTLASNFGITPEHYVMVNFWAFTQTIDSLGGIDVEAQYTLTDHRDGYGTFTVYAGTTHMDGDTALWYVRSRKTSSDFDRARRQQEVLKAIFKRLLSLDAVENAPEIYNLYVENVTTDLNLTDITPMLPLALKVNQPGHINNYVIGPGYIIPWTTPGGAQVLLPNYDAIYGLIWEATHPQ